MKCDKCGGEMKVLYSALEKGMYKEKTLWACPKCGRRRTEKREWEDERFVVDGAFLRAICKFAKARRGVVMCEARGVTCKFQCVRRWK